MEKQLEISQLKQQREQKANIHWILDWISLNVENIFMTQLSKYAITGLIDTNYKNHELISYSLSLTLYAGVLFRGEDKFDEMTD